MKSLSPTETISSYNKLRHMNKALLEREGNLPTVIQGPKEAQQMIEDGVDEDYQLTTEEGAEMDELEEL
jgi:hypothetical protein